MALLERETHLKALQQAFGDALQSNGRTVLVTGEAGIGKTSLVLQFTREVEPKARVLWGACEALFSPRPLGPFHDVVHALGGPLLERLESNTKPVDLFHALMGAIRDHDQPTVIVMEDLHWADHATLDFIRFLTRRIDRTQGLAVLTFRDDEIGVEHPLTAVVGELPAHSRLRLKLPVLSRATVEQMARATGQASPNLYRITGGNPFFVTEVLREGAADAVSSVREAVLSRARRLSEPARDLLDLVSVAPDRIELLALEQILGDDLAPLDECIDRGLLGLDDGRISFRHELARLAIENALAAVKRMRLNARILQALVAAGGTQPGPDLLTRLAHHAIAARESGGIGRYGPAAAQAATQRGAHREAAALLAAVMPHIGHLPVRDRVRFFEQRAQASLLVAQQTDAIAMSESAEELWVTLGDDYERARNLVLRCEIIWFFRPSTFHQLADLSARAIELIDPHAHSDLADLADLWRTMPASLVKPAVASERRARALLLAQRSNDPLIRVTALTDLTISEYFSFGAPVAESIELLEREARANSNDFGVMIGYVRKGWHLNRIRDLANLERCIEEGQAFARDRQLDHFISSHALDLFAAEVQAARGRLNEAEQQFNQIAQRTTLPWFFRSPYCEVPLALIKVRRDPSSEIGRVELPPETEALLLTVESYAYHRGLTEIGWLAGDDERARRSIDELARVARQWQHPWALAEVAFWHRLLGIGSIVPSELPEPYALQFAGDARGAAAAWQRRGYGYEAAIALLLGDETAKRDAISAFEAIGAFGSVERARALLRESGAKSSPQHGRASGQTNAAGLTGREIEVLGYLAQGLSNADIAARLHRSVRTVEHHVAALTTKLSVDSRQAAVVRARERGLLSRLPDRSA